MTDTSRTAPTPSSLVMAWIFATIAIGLGLGTTGWAGLKYLEWCDPPRITIGDVQPLRNWSVSILEKLTWCGYDVDRNVTAEHIAGGKLRVTLRMPFGLPPRVYEWWPKPIDGMPQFAHGGVQGTLPMDDDR
jgi:hypothetical protein